MRDEKAAKKLIGKIETEIETFQNESAKCLDGNSSAGARSRKAISALTKLFKEWRKATV